MARTGFAFTGAQSDQAVIAAPGVGKILRIRRLQFTLSSAGTIAFTDGADAAGTRLFYGDLGANGGAILESIPTTNSSPVPWAILTGNTALNVTNSAGDIKGVVEYEIA